MTKGLPKEAYHNAKPLSVIRFTAEQSRNGRLDKGIQSQIVALSFILHSGLRSYSSCEVLASFGKI
jgi:hypothetical protein